jgi:hypothetical protein
LISIGRESVEHPEQTEWYCAGECEAEPTERNDGGQSVRGERKGYAEDPASYGEGGECEAPVLGSVAVM